MTTGEWIAIAGVSVASLVLSMAIAGWLLIRIPADYFKGDHPRPSRKRPLWRRILKNLGGGVLVLVGLVLSIPGVPGQGLLMVLAGLMLLDLPGKYVLERKILFLGPVRHATTWLRRRWRRPPLQFPQ